MDLILLWSVSLHGAWCYPVTALVYLYSVHLTLVVFLFLFDNGPGVIIIPYSCITFFLHCKYDITASLVS